MSYMKIDNSFFNKTKFSFFKKQITDETFNNLKTEMLNSEFAKEYSAHEEEIKKDLMKKYFKFDYRQMQLLLNGVEKQQLMNEINEVSNDMGINTSKEKDEIAEEYIEDQAKGNNANHKESMKEKVLLAAARKRTKEYAGKVASQKEGHIMDKTIAFSKEEAMKDVADAKVLENISRQYKKIAKKDISKNKEIKREEKKMENEVNGLQKGEDVRLQHELRMREKIEKELQEEKRKLSEAIKNNDPKAKMYKERVENLEDDLVKLKKGQTDYAKEMEQQKENEELADKEKIEKYSPFTDKSNLNKKEHNKLSESKTADEIKKDREKNEKQQEITHDKDDSYRRKLKREGDYKTLNELEENAELGDNVQAHIDDSKVNGQRYDRKYSQVEKRRDEVEKENNKEENKIEKSYFSKENKSNDDFFNDLHSGVNDINSNAENIVKAEEKYDREKDKNSQNRDESYKKVAEQNKYDANRVRKASKKNNYNN